MRTSTAASVVAVTTLHREVHRVGDGMDREIVDRNVAHGGAEVRRHPLVDVLEIEGLRARRLSRVAEVDRMDGGGRVVGDVEHAVRTEGDRSRRAELDAPALQTQIAHDDLPSCRSSRHLRHPTDIRRRRHVRLNGRVTASHEQGAATCSTSSSEPSTSGASASARMGMSGRLHRRRHRRRRVDPHHPPRARPRRHPHRHRRDLRPVHQRGARRPRDQGPSRRRRPRDEVRPRLARRRRSLEPRQQPGEHPHRGRGLAPAARHRPHRPLLPAPRRPEDADRGHRRRARRARRRGQDPPHRPVRGRRRHDPPCPRRAPDHRAAVRVLAVDARPGAEGAAGAARARHRLRRLLAARPRVPHRRDPLHRRLRRRRLAARPTRASPARTSSATCAPSTRSRRSPPRSAPHRRRSPWRGCSPRATTSPRSPAPSGSPASRRTSRPTASS